MLYDFIFRASLYGSDGKAGMTQLLYIILLRVTLTGIAAAAALRLAGNGAIREMIRLSVGLLMLLAILQPIAQFTAHGGKGLRLWGVVSAKDLEEQNMKTVMSTVASSIAETLELRAAKEGIDCDIVVSMENDGNGLLQIGRVTIYYYAKDAERLEDLSAMIFQECGVNAERQELIER